MDYRVEELAAAAGVRVDTIRFYQTKGLLPAPRRRKRLAVYSDDHLARLRKIRSYQSQGLSLAVIKRLLSTGRRSRGDALLSAVAEESGERSLTRAQLAAQSGVPEPLLASLEAAGLLVSVRSDSGDETLYGEADLQMARAGMEILSQGFPLDELLQLALRHAREVEVLADAAIDLFDRSVRKVKSLSQNPGLGDSRQVGSDLGGPDGASRRRSRSLRRGLATEDRPKMAPDGAKADGRGFGIGSNTEGADSSRVADAFRRLLPASTTLVALHFQRTLLSRAIERLRRLKQDDALEAAMAAAESGRLEVSWR